jgi:hypothetical protein
MATSRPSREAMEAAFVLPGGLRPGFRARDALCEYSVNGSAQDKALLARVQAG